MTLINDKDKMLFEKNITNINRCKSSPVCLMLYIDIIVILCIIEMVVIFRNLCYYKGGLALKLNKQYKNSVFTELFGSKEKILELYSAIKGESYPADIEIEINTLQDVLFLDRINDISFIIGGRAVVLMEHQSTVNENMPLRFLLYAARLYEKISDNRDIYRKKLIKIPAPEFIVLYNGAEDFPDRQTLRLSEAFKEREAGSETELELTVKVFNINKSHNEEIVQRSRTLQGYIFFVDRIRENQKSGLALEDAATEAIKHCVNNGMLDEFLKTNSSEVLNMLCTEFNMDIALEVSKEEGREQGLELGREQGLENGRIIIAKNLLMDGDSVERVCKVTGLSRDEVEKLNSGE
jgi:predicted transposase/invertase (TIGR01784 family)